MNRTYIPFYCVLVAMVIFTVGCEKNPINQIGLPKVKTLPVTRVHSTHIILYGEVTDEGGSAVTSRGFCWAMAPNPSVNDKFSLNEFGPGKFTEVVENLKAAVTYYIRTYATNSKGTTYGNEVSYKTSDILPIITTNTITEITVNSAKGGGNISSDGGFSVTERGICWATYEEPTIYTSYLSVTQDGSGTGSFVSRLDQLSANTTYYVRAYATTSEGTAYGDQKMFKTSPVIPTVITNDVTLLTPTTAIGGGQIASDGGGSITARGVCWSTMQNPTISDTKTSDGTGSGSFISNLKGLSGFTTYYARAYATNSAGTAYGEEKSFSTDGNLEYEGRTYKCKTIGSQIWMIENLAFLPSVSPSSVGSDVAPYYYVYDYQGTNVNEAKATSNYLTYGVLYNWEAAKIACPFGWHLPSDQEWTTLTDFLGGINMAGGDMKETGTLHWQSPNSQASNKSSFSALPGGNRNGINGNFLNLGKYSYFFSATMDEKSTVWDRYLRYDNGGVVRTSHPNSYGFSVRCIKD